MKTLYYYLLGAVLLTLMVLIVPDSSYADHEISVGLFTEHYESDRKDYNEDNEFIQYTYRKDNDYAYSVSTFVNSHFERSYAVGVGHEWDETIGVYLAAIHGYENHLKTHYEGVIFIPVFYVKTYGFKHTVMGPVYNLSYTFKF